MVTRLSVVSELIWPQSMILVIQEVLHYIGYHYVSYVSPKSVSFSSSRFFFLFVCLFCLCFVFFVFVFLSRPRIAQKLPASSLERCFPVNACLTEYSCCC